MADEMFIPQTDLHICEQCGLQLVVRRGHIGWIGGIPIQGFMIPYHWKPLISEKCPESLQPVDNKIRTVLNT